MPLQSEHTRRAVLVGAAGLFGTMTYLGVKRSDEVDVTSPDSGYGAGGFGHGGYGGV